MTDAVRTDAWIWAIRLYKSRTQATAACKAGHVRVNDDRAKPSTPVRVGDRVTVRGSERERVVVVRTLLVKRVGAEPAAAAYDDHSPPPPPREYVSPFGRRDRGAGRPTKRERRQLDRLMGRG
jgi:ribosome-associated heat shock protein Hsp15